MLQAQTQPTDILCSVCPGTDTLCMHADLPPALREGGIAYESSGVSVSDKVNILEEGLQPTDNDETERLRNLIENICNEVDMATFTLRMVCCLNSITSFEMLDQ